MEVRQEVQAKKLEFVITKPIEVDSQPSDLTVKASLDMQKATWKITTSLTTKQADVSNPEVTAGVLKTLHMMLGKMVDKMIEERHQLLQPQEGKGQFTLDFQPVQLESKKEEDTEPATGEPATTS